MPHANNKFTYGLALGLMLLTGLSFAGCDGCEREINKALNDAKNEAEQKVQKALIDAKNEALQKAGDAVEGAKDTAKNALDKLGKAAPDNDQAIGDMIRVYEGKENTAYDDAGGKSIGVGHYLVDDVDKKIFKDLFGGQVDYNAVKSGNQALTDAQVEKLFQYDRGERIKTARRLFPAFDDYPADVQGTLVNMVYRGELPWQDSTVQTFESLVNNNNWLQAAEVYLQLPAYEYAVTQKQKHIVNRMQENRQRILRYANSQPAPQ